MADKEFILPIQGNKTAAEIAAINDQIARGLVTYSNSQEITLSAPGLATNGTMYRLVGEGIAAQFKPVPVDGGGNSGQLPAILDASTWARSSTPLFTEAATPYSSVYWPWVVRTDKIANPFGLYYMYYSTDHDATVGGIAMAYANSPMGPWVHYGQVFVDPATSATLGTGQTETPSVLWDPYTNIYRMFYQQVGAKYGVGNVTNAVGWQSTLSATSVDGIVWTKDPNFAIDVPAMPQVHGDGHTGYFLPFYVNGALSAYGLYGGGQGPDFVLWRSDGRTDSWTTNSISLGYSLEYTQGAPLNGRRTEWNSSFVVEAGARQFFIGRLSNNASGGGGSDCLIGIAPISDDFRRLLARPRVLWSPSQSWESVDLRCVNPFVDGGRLYVYYSVKNGSTFNIGVLSHAI